MFPDERYGWRQVANEEAENGRAETRPFGLRVPKQ